jgi:hypothetical protein
MSPWASGPLLGLAFGFVVVLVNREGADGASFVKSGVAGGVFFGILMTAYLLWRRDQERSSPDPEQESRHEHESHR